MYALLAFRRRCGDLESTTAIRYQLGFELRYMGCFNGFNRQYNTFRPGAGVTNNPDHSPNPENDGCLDLVLEVDRDGRARNSSLQSPLYFLPQQATGSGLGVDTNGNRRINSEEAALWDAEQALPHTPWECIAIGYMVDKAYNAWANNGDSDFILSQVNPQGASILSREACRQEYYDYDRGGLQRSSRPHTPNEIFLSNFLKSADGTAFAYDRLIHRSRGDYLSRGLLSKMLPVFYHSTSFYNCLMDFVGSERPSGLAIAYLQVWRNTARQVVTNYAGKPGGGGIVRQFMADCWPTNKSAIPLLSYLFNNGDDSDILTFAGKEVLFYMMKNTVFNCAELFRCSDSMLIEQKYNKGAQSAVLRQNFESKARLARWSMPQGVTTHIEALQSYSKNLDEVTSCTSNVQLAGAMRSDESRGVLERKFGQALQRLCNNNPRAALQALIERLPTVPDFRTPPAPSAPVSRTDGSAQSFVQWTAQAENPTVH